MQTDAAGLAQFYDTAMGQIARRAIMRRIRVLWPSIGRERILGYGFATPYLRGWIAPSERAVALMPAQQGVVVWPDARPLCALGEEDCWPFPDAMFDRILIVHGLEAADAVRPLMRQVWRVLAPNGKLLVVAPNRRSLWSLAEASPFAQGTPFTAAQLARVLSDSLFVPERWDCALLYPPLSGRRVSHWGLNWEGIGRRLWPGLAGVHLVEARKTLYGVPAIKPALRRRQLAPAPAHHRSILPPMSGA